VLMSSTGKIVFLFILIITFLESKLGDFVGKYVTSPKEKYFGLMCIKIAFINSCNGCSSLHINGLTGFRFTSFG